MARALGTAFLTASWFVESCESTEESSMLQMPAVAETLIMQSDLDESDCRCPGYYEEQCRAEAAQGCIWTEEGESNAPWCQCDANFVPPPRPPPPPPAPPAHPPAPPAPPPPPPVSPTEPDPQCGALPQLLNAVWNPSADAVLQYYCEDGFSFDGLNFVGQIRDVECLANGQFTEVRACLPIDDCAGHACGAFGTCVDLHMDYTCECVEGHDMHVEDGGEKVCGNIEDCDGVQCGEGGICVDLIQEHECQCYEGWRQAVVDGAQTCERVECGDAPQVDNLVATVDDPATASGIFPWTRGKAVFEETVEYVCAHGYSTDGQLGGPRSFSILCQADRNFTETSQCLPISCGEPESVGAATPSLIAPVLFGQTADYSCPPGYGPETFTRTCLEDGEFSPAIACEPRLCGPLPVFPLASITSTESMFFFGQTADLSCPEGYATDPTNPLARDFAVECLADGWDTAIGGCLPVTCEVVPDDSHAADSAFFIDYDGINIVLCKEGHSVDGTAAGATELAATCAPNGVAQVEPCRPVTCQAAGLQIAPNAEIQDHRDYTLSTRATYACREGHAVALTSASTFEVECLRSGSFSAMSTCRNIDDCAGHSCGSNGQCVDGIGDYSCACEAGFEETLSDSGEKICGNRDDCGTSACGAHGACHDLVNGFVCECEHGYDLQGAGDDPVCVPKLCPIELERATTEESELHFPDTTSARCVEGHSLGDRADFQIECTADGVLTSGGSTDLPECRPVVCGEAPAVFAEHVEVRDYTFGESAVSVCQGGDVQIIHECQFDGQFKVTSELSTCQNSCGVPSVPPNAQRSNGVSPVLHPASASYICFEGFTPLASGSPGQEFSQACRADGVFEPLTVAADGCVPVVCEKPAAPQNWEWVDDATFDTQTSALLKCVDGYQSSQSRSEDQRFEITCDSNGISSLVPDACQVLSYTLSGRIRNAVVPSQILSDATFVFADQTLTLDGNNRFTVSVPAGHYGYTLSAEGYISITEGSVTVSASTNEYDLYMSPVMEDGTWRIVLTWDQHPRDLDSHLVFHGESTNQWYGCPEMYYGRTRASCGGVEALLDVDDTSSFGPETTTLSSTGSCNRWTRTCKWVYRVKNYGGFALYDFEHGWVHSQAVVTLYKGGDNDDVHSEFKVGEQGHTAGDGIGDWSADEQSYFWSVFSIDADGNVEPCTNANCD